LGTVLVPVCCCYLKDTFRKNAIILFRNLRLVRRSIKGRRIIVNVLNVDDDCCITFIEVIRCDQSEFVLLPVFIVKRSCDVNRSCLILDRKGSSNVPSCDFITNLRGFVLILGSYCDDSVLDILVFIDLCLILCLIKVGRVVVLVSNSNSNVLGDCKEKRRS